jgi:F-type H+-transporting ATPase subunit delta
MSTSTSSKRYAQAVFQIARDKNTLAQWQVELKKLARLLDSAEFISVIENPKVPFELKSKFLKELLGKTDSLVLNLGYLLIIKNKFKYTGQIAEEYDRLFNEYRGIKNAEVTTATAIDESEQKKVTSQLERILGSKVVTVFNVEPAIIGGIIARIDGTLIDGSIRSKLENLKKNMAGINK